MKTVVNTIFFAIVTICFLGGAWIGGVWCGAAGIVLGVISMFAGRIIGLLQGGATMSQSWGERETTLRAEMDELAHGERELCMHTTVNVARSAVDRVVDRLVAKHWKGLHNEEQREAIFTSANAIIDEEVSALEQAIRDEAMCP